MAAAFFLLLREGLEAALIVGIIVAYLVKLGRRDATPRRHRRGRPPRWSCRAAIGLLVTLTVGRLPLAVQETLEGLAGLFAVTVLTWMLFWMRRQGRAMKGELEHGRRRRPRSRATSRRSSGLAFVAVAREGLETVLFLFALLAPRRRRARQPTVIGPSLGLAVAIAIGYGIFAAGVRIDLRRFFTDTGVVLIFVSAGLVAFAIHEFGEAA